MSKQEDKPEERKEERQIEVRIEEGGAQIPLETRQEVTIEEPHETQELRVQVPSEYQLSSEEMTNIAKEAANKHLDTLKGSRAAVRSIIARIQRSIRVSNIQRISKISEIVEIFRR